MKRWYVVHTQTNSEIRAATNLLRQGFETYLPRYLKLRRHARKVDRVARPLFPRYLFVRLDVETDRWRSIDGTFGVSHLLTCHDKPIAIGREIIDAMRTREDDAGFVSFDPPEFQPGQRLEIVEGPLAMQFGFFKTMPDSERVTLLFELLGREVPITMPRAAVAAA